MNRIILSVLFLSVSAGLVLAQEAAVPANAVVVNETEEAVVNAVPENMDAVANDEMVNDEGYGAEDSEYYGGEEETTNMQGNVAEDSMEKAEEPPVNAVAK